MRRTTTPACWIEPSASASYGVPIAAAAIELVLRHPAVTAVVVGAREATEVIEDVTYLTAAVPAELLAELGTGPAGDD